MKTRMAMAIVIGAAVCAATSCVESAADRAADPAVDRAGDDAGGNAVTPDLRGFGRVKVEDALPSKASGGASSGGAAAMSFKCETPEKAEAVAGKFLMDLYAVDGVVFRDGIHETPGGAAFAVGRDGARTTIYAADSRAALEDALPRPAPAGGFVASAAVPEYMKAFRWGTYGMGGLEDFHNWMQKSKEVIGIDPKADKSRLDPREDYAFLAGMGGRVTPRGAAGDGALTRDGMHFDNWLEQEKLDNSDGIVAPGVWSRRKLAEDFGVPFGYRLYMPDGSWGATSRRFGSHMETPAPWLESGWHGAHEHRPHFSWNDPDIYGYIAARTKDAMLAVKTPGARSWMHPVGELVHRPWYDWHSDYSPAASNSWHAFLKGRGVSLGDAAAMYNRAGCPFASWDEVPVPEFATFAGLPGMVLDLAGEWLTAPVTDEGLPPADQEWRRLPDFPGNWDFLSLYLKEGEKPTSQFDDGRHAWQKEHKRVFRRSFEWHPASGGGRIWLYFFPMSGASLRHGVSLNGGAPHTVGNWCAIDVTDELREGANTLDITLQGTVWNGRIFLSADKPEMYPNMDEARCRLWTSWHEWRRDTKAARSEQIFDAMRQADPDAPIEFMAPLHFGQRVTNRLMRDWGAFAHFTGEGVWFFPWYKRYGKLYGYQGTSELAGPYDSVAKARTSSLRVFLAGIDMHKPVFMTQTYSRVPEVRGWWLAHRGLFARMGTYDIDLAQPQVLIYRRTELTGDPFPAPFPEIDAAVKDVRSPWNYDIGRGELQSIGQSFLYLDDDGIEDGKMEGFKVMFDCGNEIVSEEHVARIREWVGRGGVFVAYPFTGKSTPLKADAWPMAALTGSKILENAVRPGYVPKVVFPEESAFFPSFAGQAIHGAKRRLHQNDFALEIVADDAEPILKWEDGRIAATARRVGKGLVVHLGSMFWRGSVDVKGMWNPSDEVERAFLRDLLAAVGHQPALVETDDRLVLAQPYRSNDGLSLVAVLCNFNEEEPESGGQARGEVVVRLRTGRRPCRIVGHAGAGVLGGGGDGSAVLPFDWDEASGVATLKVPLPPQEVAVLDAGCHGAGDALAYWWRNTATQWHEIKKPTRDFSKYGSGEWRDPTQDLKNGWEVSASGGDAGAGGAAPSLKAVPLDCLQFWGWPDGKGAVARKTFDLGDPSWAGAPQGGAKAAPAATRLVLGAWVGPNFLTPASIRLNGATLAERTEARYLDFDVAAILRPAGNVLEVEFADAPDGALFTGLCGSIYLYRRDAPGESIWIKGGAGDAAQGAGGGAGGEGASPVPVVSTGAGGGDAMELFVPAEWLGKYRVRLYMEGARNVPKGVKVRDRFARKHHHNFGGITDIDITGILRFGETNRIEFGAVSPGELPDKTSAKALDTIRIDLYGRP